MLMNKNDFPMSWALADKIGPTVGGVVQNPKNANCKRGKKCNSCTLCTDKLDIPVTQ